MAPGRLPTQNSALVVGEFGCLGFEEKMRGSTADNLRITLRNIEGVVACIVLDCSRVL